MNREIKFRAWCHSYGMHYDIEAFDKNGGVCIGLKSDTWLSGVLMQFTGLTDKNGKEIYEGDILRAIEINAITTNCKVEFEQGMFCVVSLVDDYLLDELYRHRNSEIIGNIYENPELI